jgi:uncharacterized protein YceK
VRLFSATLVLVLLSGCASQLSKYVRTDGAPVNAAQEQAAMAQCKGEAATTVTGSGLSELRKEDTVINACMARNGYVQAR